MNSIRRIQDLNKLEIENGISPSASWHTDHRSSAFIYVGGLPFELTEGDIITIFSQYGTPTYINLIRDKETGKSRGFAFLKYEDQRSTDLAVDNLGGAVIKGRTLNVDHTVYKKRNDEPDEGTDLTALDRGEGGDGSESEEEERRPMIREEVELAKLMEDQDDEDPMKAFLIEEKREEVKLALARVKQQGDKKPEKERRHRHHHKSRRIKGEDGDRDEKQSRHRSERESKRARSVTPVRNSTASRGRSRSVTPVRNGAKRRDSRSITPVRKKSSREDDGRRDDRSERRRSRSPRRDSRERNSRDRDDDTRKRRGDSRDRRRRDS